MDCDGCGYVATHDGDVGWVVGRRWVADGGSCCYLLVYVSTAISNISHDAICER